ncbi:MAG: glucosyltransferase domain-containing protein [Acetatifactor sp.]
MRRTVQDILHFFQNKCYCALLLLTALLSYGFAVTHYSIGMDDTAIPLYFEEGLAPYVGRWTLFIINKVLPIGDFAPWLVELLSVLILMLSATLWCVLWKRICEPGVEIPVWGYAFVAGIFLSCPLISEVFVFYLHNGVCTGYGVVALALLSLLNSLRVGANRKEITREVLFSALLLCVALGFYESFVIVYIMGAVMMFFLCRLLYGKKNEDNGFKKSFLPWAGRGLLVLLLALLGRAVVLAVIKAAYRLDSLSIYNVQYRKFFGDIFTTENELQMVLKRFIMKYYVNALVYLPITVLVAALVCIGIAAVYFGIKKRDGLLPLCFAALVILPIAMSLLEGLATRYRSAQYVPVIGAFAVLLLFVFLYTHKPQKVLKALCTGLLGILLFHQAVEMNKWFYVDYLKYQDTVRVMETIAYDLEREFDTSKPVVFRGAYKVPYEIASEAYIGFDSWQFQAICRLTDPFDIHIKEKYYAEDAAAYVFAEMPVVSTLQWGVTAFDGTSQQLINFWNMHGIGGFSCVKDLAVIEEAERIRSEENMPGYPQDGYLKECDDYIIINMSD